MDRDLAIDLKDHGLKAVMELGLALDCCYERCSPEEYGILKNAVGLSIGRINRKLLDVVYAQYPDLDDLKDFDAAEYQK